MQKTRILSFKYAWDGILTAFKDEPNLKIHFVIACLVIFLGFYFSITLLDWFMVIFAIGFVVAVELTNTAIEEIVNSFTSDTHPGAKKAKDVAAGAVLVAAITALIIGLLVFLPYIV